LKPFFSVVIPTFNAADKIQRPIESVLKQTYTNFEILVMDDGSTDNTSKIVKSYNSSKLIYDYSENFGGPARPRNRGIELAKGDWICFLDSDDWWTLDKLEVCAKHINDNVDLIYHYLGIVSEISDDFVQKKMKSRQLKKPIFFDLLLNENPIANSSVVVRKSLLESIGGINESNKMIASEDYNTWLRLSKRTDYFLFIPSMLGYYFSHSNSISKKDMSDSYRESVNEFLYSLNYRQRRIVECYAKYISGRHYYLQKEYKIAFSTLIKSIIGGKKKFVIRSMFLLFLITFKSLGK